MGGAHTHYQQANPLSTLLRWSLGLSGRIGHGTETVPYLKTNIDAKNTLGK